MIKQPAIFVSHGAPTVLIEPSSAHDFLSDLGNQLEKPKAILSVTAHWASRIPAISVSKTPKTIHDFGNFADVLYQVDYPAPGDPDLGVKAANLLNAAGIEVEMVADRGNDHGTWVPLKLAYPAADIPVIQMSIQPHETAAWHFELGRALRPLRDDNVLIMASGAVTHNLRAFFYRESDETPDWVREFVEWVQVAISENNMDDLLQFEEKAPHASKNHPTIEHFLPLFVAMGAGALEEPGQRIHHSIEAGVMAMDAYRFN